MHLVLDLGLGQRRAVVDAPVDRLQSAIDEALFKEAVKGLQRARFVVAGHGLVGRIPAAKAANALKLRGLQVDVFLRVGAAGLQNGRNRHLKLFAAQVLVHLDLDGQAVAVVAGDVGSVESGHGFGFDDEILEAFVEGVAQVNGAVGVRRAVVEQVGGAAAPALRSSCIEAAARPSGPAEGVHSGADWPSWERRFAAG